MLKLRYPRSLTTLPHLAALRHRDYRHTWAANMFSGAAMWTFIVASSWFVLVESDSSGWVGVITFAAMIPFLIVSPVAGLMADRFDRRRLALLTFVAGFANAAVLAALALAGVVELWHFAVLALIGGVFRATQEPAVQALIPNQVPREDLLNAMALNAASRHGARFFGLAVAAPLMAIDSVGVSGVLVLSALFHALGAVELARARTASQGESQPEHGVVRGMVDASSISTATRRSPCSSSWWPFTAPW